MENKLETREKRRVFSVIGWALVLYMVLMNVMVSIVAVVDCIGAIINVVLSENPDMSQLDAVAANVANNGWGYLVTIAIGLVILLAWKKKKFFREEIFARGKPMSLGEFAMLLCVFLSFQQVFQLLATAVEAVFNLFGFSILDSLEGVSGSADSFSMFLYMGIGAPIAEEILFRGLVLRTLRPYGKRFAIILSAFLFGIYHGNLLQTPFAFLVGLVLGYVALEYSIAWAMVLHMINNLVVADVFTRIASYMPGNSGDVLLTVLFWAVAIGAVIIFGVKYPQYRAYKKENPVDDRTVGAFFTSPGILVLTVMMWLSIGMMLAAMIFM